jgi:DNA repair protein RecO (recombination protein O)
VVEAGPADGAISGALLQRLQQSLDDGAMAMLQATCAQGAGPLKAALRALLHYHLGSPRLRTREVMIDAQQQLLDLPRQEMP